MKNLQQRTAMRIRRTQSESDLPLLKHRRPSTSTSPFNKKDPKQRTPSLTPGQITSQHAQERIALEGVRSKLHHKLCLRHTHDARTTGLEQLLETARDMPALAAVRRQHPIDMQALTRDIENTAEVLKSRVRAEYATRLALIEEFAELKETGSKATWLLALLETLVDEKCGLLKALGEVRERVRVRRERVDSVFAASEFGGRRRSRLRGNSLCVERVGMLGERSGGGRTGEGWWPDFSLDLSRDDR
ncbi:hypothetical protein BDY17DRAFT_24960 [Neohortaea acidophila]|uniref:Uncharacterized protein n=1 Tax=Neohortaea acidophila TaxID=245834 RepID=A0A6A6Q941_9PEZI|nr:uncharacterized protein BDY17DRAFT_24960 [Neohortaea acidophila]KAF2488163.1 hypothetical protein BDY17DRAFT_24960 [Neohortaea acidophila]